MLFQFLVSYPTRGIPRSCGLTPTECHGFSVDGIQEDSNSRRWDSEKLAKGVSNERSNARCLRVIEEKRGIEQTLK
ncbi:MAG: hypothetical protein QW706_09240 [Candidatus Nezhaarchaeales archaeon]